MNYTYEDRRKGKKWKQQQQQIDDVDLFAGWLFMFPSFALCLSLLFDFDVVYYSFHLCIRDINIFDSML